jgi:hypothetical protein
MNINLIIGIIDLTAALGLWWGVGLGGFKRVA